MRLAAILLIASLPAFAAEPPAPNAAAATPAATAAPAAAPPAATPAASTAPATTAATAATAAVSAATLKKAVRLGFHVRKHEGKTMYCRDSANIGTRIPTEHCYEADQLDDLIRQTDLTQDQMMQRSACGTPSCGSR
jgi:hypothetical protein